MSQLSDTVRPAANGVRIANGKTDDRGPKPEQSRPARNPRDAARAALQQSLDRRW